MPEMTIDHVADIQIAEGWEVTLRLQKDEKGKYLLIAVNNEQTAQNALVVVEDGYNRSDDGPGWINCYRLVPLIA